MRNESRVHHEDLPRSLTDRIPREIFDHIIDHLHSDLPALLRCSLISRSWLRTSRYHLPALEIRRRNVNTLKKLLNSPQATLGAFTRRVAIRAGKIVRPDRFLGRSLPAVESLLLSTPFRPITQVLSWVPYAHQLVELVLYSAVSDSLADFAEGLREFKVLRHIGLVGVHWATSHIASSNVEDGASDHINLLPSLRSLVLKADSAHLITWLLERNVVSIQRLDLRQTGRNMLGISQTRLDVGHCYRVIGPNLHELDLYGDDYNSIDLSANVNLCEIWFHDVVLSLSEWVITVLSTVTSDHLHSITLYMFSDDHGRRGHLGAFNWPAFGKVLARSAFQKQLRLVRVLWLGFYDDEDLKVEMLEKLAEHLPHNVEYIVNDVISEAGTMFGTTTHEHLFDRHSRMQFGTSRIG